MPRACPVELHVRCYKTPRQDSLQDATGLPRGGSRSLLILRLAPNSRCHGLAPWSLTLAANPAPGPLTPDATGLPRGASRSLLQDTTTRFSSRCHGLAPWSFTFAANPAPGP